MGLCDKVGYNINVQIRKPEGYRNETERKHSIEYSDYMQSDVWRDKRQQRIDIDGHRCAACGCKGLMSDNPLEVHHFSYKKPFGQEDVYTDLVTLCRHCHRNIHRMMNRRTAVDRFGWASCESLPRQVKDYGKWGKHQEQLKKP